MYCIYANRDIAEENGNYDHIFPLTLGEKISLKSGQINN